MEGVREHFTQINNMAHVSKVILKDLSTCINLEQGKHHYTQLTALLDAIVSVSNLGALRKIVGVENTEKGTEMYEQLVALIREEIDKRMQQKTSWGRNELKIELDAAMISAQARFLDSVPCLKGAKGA